MKRYPFAPGAIQGGTRLKSRLARARRWLVRHELPLSLALIVTAFAGFFLGLEGVLMWLLVAVAIFGVISLEWLENAERVRDMEDL